MIEVVDSESIKTNASVAVVSDDIQVDTNIVHNHNVEVFTNNYVLTTAAGLGLATSGTPAWLAESIQIALDNGLADTQELIHDLGIILDSLQTGVNQQISSIESAVAVQNIKIDSNVSRIGTSEAAILHVEETYVTEDSASTISADILGSAITDGTVANEAMVVGLAQTEATNVVANSTILNGVYSIVNDAETGNVSLAGATNTMYSSVGIEADGTLATAGHLIDINASVDGVDVRLQTEEAVSIGTHIWDGAEELRIGMRDVTLVAPTGVSKTYMGGLLGWTIDTQLDSSDAQGDADTALVWSAGASSMSQDPITGAAIGWNYADGSNMDMPTFAIQADKFELMASSQTAAAQVPFSVNATTGVITMTSQVLFQDANASLGTTTIDGGNITADSVTANEIDTTDLVVQNVSPGGVNPIFEIKADSTAGPIGDKNYTIYGGSIYGSTMESSTMRIRDLIVVTDADKETSTILKGSGNITNLDLYSYNSTDISTKKLATLNENVILFTGETSTFVGGDTAYSYNGYVFFGLTIKGSTVTIKLGTTVLGTVTSTTGNSDIGNSTISGIDIAYTNWTNGLIGGSFWWIPSAATPSLSGNGVLSISISDSPTYKNIAYTVINL